jgi:hypothetical protein
MDFGEAFRIMKAGGAVQRGVWGTFAHVPHEYHHIRLSDPDGLYGQHFVAVLNDGTPALFELTHWQVFAEDWKEHTGP